MAMPRTLSDTVVDGPLGALLRYPRVFLALFCLILFTPGLTSLPPLDRDESRYAQATKQMMETGDFIEIQFQEEARNKKPVGIYWMQSLSASVFSSAPFTEIWAYRIPSVIGAICVVLLVFGLGERLFDRETGLAAGGIMAATLLLIGEAHIAKTDSVQLACIVAAQAMFAKFYFADRFGEPRPGWAWSWALWGAVGLGILVKGPLTPFFCGMTVVALSLWERRFGWIWHTRPIFGSGIIILIVLPWLLAIMLVTKGEFLEEAWGRDFAGKIVSSQEGHWGPPGYYLGLLPATFWPGSLFLVPAAIFAWANRADPVMRFLIAWAVPAWIVLELMSTKLPHYVLPLYPALALLCAGAVVTGMRQGGMIFSHITAKIGIAAWLLVTLCIAFVLLVFVPAEYGAGTGLFLYALLLPVLLSAGFAAYFLFQQDAGRALAAALISATVLAVAALGAAVPRLDQLKLSPRAAELAASAGATANRGEKLAIAGYAEPSFVFLAGTKTTLTTPEGAAQFLIDHSNSFALIDKETADAGFRKVLTAKGYTPEALGQVSGINYSKNRKIQLTLFRLRKSDN